MRALWKGALGILVLLTMLRTVPTAEASKPCPRAEPAIHAADVLVRGQIVLKPFPNVWLIRVDRYYSGQGRRYVIAETRGQFSTSNWQLASKRDALFAFQVGDGLMGGLYFPPCGFRDDRGEYVPTVPGAAPFVGIDARSPLFFVYLGLLLAAVAVIRGVALSIRRRRGHY